MLPNHVSLTQKKLLYESRPEIPGNYFPRILENFTNFPIHGNRETLKVNLCYVIFEVRGRDLEKIGKSIAFCSKLFALTFYFIINNNPIKIIKQKLSKLKMLLAFKNFLLADTAGYGPETIR